jgi:hypothetical protein
MGFKTSSGLIWTLFSCSGSTRRYLPYAAISALDLIFLAVMSVFVIALGPPLVSANCAAIGTSGKFIITAPPGTSFGRIAFHRDGRARCVEMFAVWGLFVAVCGLFVVSALAAGMSFIAGRKAKRGPPIEAKEESRSIPPFEVIKEESTSRGTFEDQEESSTARGSFDAREPSIRRGLDDIGPRGLDDNGPYAPRTPRAWSRGVVPPFPVVPVSRPQSKASVSDDEARLARRSTRRSVRKSELDHLEKELYTKGFSNGEYSPSIYGDDDLPGSPDHEHPPRAAAKPGGGTAGVPRLEIWDPRDTDAHLKASEGQEFANVPITPAGRSSFRKSLRRSLLPVPLMVGQRAEPGPTTPTNVKSPTATGWWGALGGVFSRPNASNDSSNVV